MKKKSDIKINPTKSNSYHVIIGEDLWDWFADNLPAIENYTIITDNIVNQLYANNLENSLKRKSYNYFLVDIHAGEQSKSRDIKALIEDKMLENNIGRNSSVLCLGGGVVTDIGGFVAATYMRGIPYYNIPTTLLAMIDASVGGKCAVNTNTGKNLIGVFYQPSMVLINVETILSLPQREYKNGLAEIWKHGAIKDRNYWNWLKEHIDEINKRDLDVMAKVIEQSIIIKGQVVNEDEKETEYRKILNFGHTIGHAIERESNFDINHGEAVSIGMVIEASISNKMGLISEHELEEIKYALNSTGLPVKIPSDLDIESIIERTLWDKKTELSKPKYVLLEKIGTVKQTDKKVTFEIDSNLVKEVLNSFI